MAGQDGEWSVVCNLGILGVSQYRDAPKMVALILKTIKIGYISEQQTISCVLLYLVLYCYN